MKNWKMLRSGTSGFDSESRHLISNGNHVNLMDASLIIVSVRGNVKSSSASPNWWNLKYLYAMMDEQTRFWIAQEVADTKYTSDVRPLFQLAKAVAGKAPKTLVSDGAANFHEAYTKEFYTSKLETRPEHIRHIRLAGDYNNNKMERMNGEIRDRERVMRGLEKKDTPILMGYQLFHNYIRPHTALGGQTPAERAGIRVEGENKWLTLIQNASQQTNFDNTKKLGEQSKT